MQTAENLRVKGLSESSAQDNYTNINHENNRYRSSASYGNVKYRRLHCDNQLSRKIKTEPFSPLQESSPKITTSKNMNQLSTEKINPKSPFEIKNSPSVASNNKIINPSTKMSYISNFDKNSLASVSSGSFVNGVGIASAMQSKSHFKISPDISQGCPLPADGETIKRKRGRPRTLDTDSDVYKQFLDIEEEEQSGKIYLIIKRKSTGIKF